MHNTKKYQECLDNNPKKAEKANLAFEKKMADDFRGDLNDRENALF